MTNKEIIGDPIIINGRKLSLSRAVRAGDYLFLTGQVPMVDGKVMTDGTIEEQTKVVLNEIVKTMVWLRSREDFPGFNSVYCEFFPSDPPARSAVLNELLVDVKVEIEVVAYDPK